MFGWTEQTNVVACRRRAPGRRRSGCPTPLKISPLNTPCRSASLISTLCGTPASLLVNLIVERRVRRGDRSVALSYVMFWAAELEDRRRLGASDARGRGRRAAEAPG